jgi:hypothetical protein
MRRVRSHTYTRLWHQLVTAVYSPVLLAGSGADGLDGLQLVQRAVLQQHTYGEWRVPGAVLCGGDVGVNDAKDFVPVRSSTRSIAT